MIAERRTLWEQNEQIWYDMYLRCNSVEIDPDRLRPAIVICGGGGFLRVSQRNQEPVALFFLEHEYQVFVLNYSTRSSGNGQYPYPLYDLAKMVATIREHAREWHIMPDCIAILGFSSGGTLCASLSAQWQESFLQEHLKVPAEQFKPNAAILCYPLVDYQLEQEQLLAGEGENPFSPSIGMRRNDYMQISLETTLGFRPEEAWYRKVSPLRHVTDHVPPTFLWHTAADELVSAEQSVRYAQKLAECGVPYELHIFEQGVHGMSLANEKTAAVPELIDPDVEIWTELALRFLKRHLRIYA